MVRPLAIDVCRRCSRRKGKNPMTRTFLAAIVLLGLSGTAWADQINGLVTDPPGVGPLIPIPPVGFCPPDCFKLTPDINVNPNAFVNVMSGTKVLVDGIQVYPPRYTVAEIDRVRAAEKTILTDGTLINGTKLCVYILNGVMVPRPPCQAPDPLIVEARVQTDIAAGIRPEELEGMVK
jgi:hypothetical protein